MKANKPSLLEHLASISMSDGQFAFFSRYDAHLLLDRPPSPLPSGAAESTVASPESVGWSYLPSDEEDTFSLTPDETEEYHRQSGGG
jgi:hypothetical protein